MQGAVVLNEICNRPDVLTNAVTCNQKQQVAPSKPVSEYLGLSLPCDSMSSPMS
jgi:hypothetical protein